MHFLLLVLRMVLDRLLSAWDGSLQLAARADGRLEHLPAQDSLWNRWLSRSDGHPLRRERAALAVRALGEPPPASGNTTIPDAKTGKPRAMAGP